MAAPLSRNLIMIKVVILRLMKPNRFIFSGNERACLAYGKQKCECKSRNTKKSFSKKSFG